MFLCVNRYTVCPARSCPRCGGSGCPCSCGSGSAPDRKSRCTTLLRWPRAGCTAGADLPRQGSGGAGWGWYARIFAGCKSGCRSFRRGRQSGRQTRRDRSAPVAPASCRHSFASRWRSAFRPPTVPTVHGKTPGRSHRGRSWRYQDFLSDCRLCCGQSRSPPAYCSQWCDWPRIRSCA